MMRLNVEEMNLLYMFDNSSRKAAVQDILDRFPFLENEELKEICQQTVKKLENMTDDEFDAIDFTIYDAKGKQIALTEKDQKLIENNKTDKEDVNA